MDKVAQKQETSVSTGISTALVKVDIKVTNASLSQKWCSQRVPPALRHTER